MNFALHPEGAASSDDCPEVATRLPVCARPLFCRGRPGGMDHLPIEDPPGEEPPPEKPPDNEPEEPPVREPPEQDRLAACG
jgi:hypothetical protein